MERGLRRQAADLSHLIDVGEAQRQAREVPDVEGVDLLPLSEPAEDRAELVGLLMVKHRDGGRVVALPELDGERVLLSCELSPGDQ